MNQMVVLDISLSLDGYMRGPNPDAEHVLGKRGEELHAWVGAGATEADLQMLSESIQSAGAVICGRRTYDDSLPSWRADGPTGPERLPVFVVSHSTPRELIEGGVYRFEHSITAALEAARTAAKGKHVCVMGGADVGRQFLSAGLIDELSLHIAPVMLGGGTRMFEDSVKAAKLKIKAVIHAPCATHIRYEFSQRP